MKCANCGAELASSSAVCYACGASVGANAPGEGGFQRPGAITLLAILNFIGGGLMLLTAAVLIVAAAASGGSEAAAMLGAVLIAALGAVYVATGSGLWTLKSYGRTLQLIFAWFGLLGFPIGTIISVIILVYLFKPGVKLIFSGRSAAELTPDESAMVAQVARASTGIIVAVVIVAIVGIIAVVGIVAAIAIPSLLRARTSANESAAIGDIRMLISAEMAYAIDNGGFYDRPECLQEPTTCRPGYAGASFLGAPLISPKNGYARTFHAGEPAGADEIRSANASPSSVRSFAYVAVPVDSSQGTRGFCGDSTGRVCATTGGSAPEVAGGLCSAACPDLR